MNAGLRNIRSLQHYEMTKKYKTIYYEGSYT